MKKYQAMPVTTQPHQLHNENIPGYHWLTVRGEEKSLHLIGKVCLGWPVPRDSGEMHAAPMVPGMSAVGL